MFGVIHLSTYLTALVLVILLPGPNSLFVLSVGARKGVFQGYQAALGVFVGDAILMTLAATGGAVLLKSNPSFFVVVKIIGAGYLAYLGLKLMGAGIQDWRSGRGDHTIFAKQPEAEQAMLEKPFRKALFISLLNPKAILFFVSFFVQFVDPQYAYPTLSFLVLGAFAQLFSLIYLSVLIFAGEYFASLVRRNQWLRVIGLAGVGALFLGFAGKLATAHLE
jgi:leucine efflux protein